MHNHTIVKTLLIAAITAFSIKANAQAPPILLQKCYGGSGNDVFNCIRQTSDGGFIVAGTTSSNDGDLAGIGSGMWVMKLDPVGNIQWNLTYTNLTPFAAHGDYIEQTSDSGYIVTGSQTLKLDKSGGVTWLSQQRGTSVHQTSDGGYILCVGSTDGPGVVKYTSGGAVAWQKTYNVSATSDPYYEIWDACQSPGGGYMVTGGYRYDVGGIWGFISKIDDVGNIIRPITQFASHAQGTQIAKTYDGRYVMVARKNNYYIILKFDDTCGIQWNKEVKYMGFSGVAATDDGAYVACGYNKWSTADALVMKFDNGGNVLWSKAMGGSAGDNAQSVIQAASGNFVIAGSTNSNDSDVSGNHGGGDAWLVIFGTNVGIPDAHNFGTDVEVFPVPANETVEVKLPEEFKLASLRVIDMLGRTLNVLEDKNANIRTLHLDRLAPGEYILRIVADGVRINKKIVHY